MKKNFLILLLMLVLCEIALASDYQKVVRVTGKVKIWRPWTGAWSFLRSADQIPNNALVLVTEGATLTYLSSTSASQEANEITISTPLAFRADGNEIKKLEIIHHEIDSLPEIPDVEIDLTDNIVQNISDAWTRTIVTLKGGKSPVQKELYKNLRISAKIRKRFELDVNDQIIEIISPTTKKIVSVTRFPRSIDLHWKVKKEIPFKEFMIYYWRNGETPQIIARASRPFYKLTLQEYGDFNVKIAGVVKTPTENDFHEVSGTISLHLVPEKEQIPREMVTNFNINRTNTNDFVAIENEIESVAIAEVFPPAGTQFTNPALPNTVEFVWKDKFENSKVSNYELVIGDREGGEIMKFSSTRRYFDVDFDKFGDYSWFISAKTQNGDVLWNSLPRLLTVSKSSDLSNKGLVYLTNGLGDL